jgi:hypothetical protein
MAVWHGRHIREHRVMLFYEYIFVVDYLPNTFDQLLLLLCLLLICWIGNSKSSCYFTVIGWKPSSMALQLAIPPVVRAIGLFDHFYSVAFTEA